MKQKKIIMFMPSIERGGVEKNFFIISNFLQKKFNDLTIITSDVSKLKKGNKNIKIIDSPVFFQNIKSRYVKYFICLMTLIRKILNDKNVIVLSFQANIYAILICKLFGIKILVRANASSLIWASNLFKIIVFKWIFKIADGVIVNSKDLKKEFLMKFKVDAEVIYNPLNMNEIISLSKKKTKEKFFNKKGPYLKIINIGRLTHQKDQITFLKALYLIKEKIKFKALIVGSGVEKKNLNKYIRGKNMLNEVKIVNYKSNPFPLLKKADLFILTSLYEGLPNVLLEALVLKKIVFSTNCQTGPREILENGKNGTLFKVKDHKTLSKKILEFDQDKKKYYKKLKYFKTSLRKFDQKRNLDKYYSIIKKIL